MKDIIRKIAAAGTTTLAFAATFSLSVPAFAGATPPIGDFAARLPEPDTLALLAIGAVAVLALRWSRRK